VVGQPDAVGGLVEGAAGYEIGVSDKGVAPVEVFGAKEKEPLLEHRSLPPAGRLNSRTQEGCCKGRGISSALFLPASGAIRPSESL
jgi:hypothetical protein